MPLTRTVRTCPYEGCRWEYEEPFPVLDGNDLSLTPLGVREATEKSIKAHLDVDHEGWTLESLRRMVAGQRLQRLMGIGPTEMFG